MSMIVTYNRRMFWWFFAAVQVIFAGWSAYQIINVYLHGGIPAFCGRLGGGPVTAYSCSAMADGVPGTSLTVILLAWVLADLALGIAATCGTGRRSNSGNRRDTHEL